MRHGSAGVVRWRPAKPTYHPTINSPSSEHTYLKKSCSIENAPSSIDRGIPYPCEVLQDDILCMPFLNYKLMPCPKRVVGEEVAHPGNCSVQDQPVSSANQTVFTPARECRSLRREVQFLDAP